LFLISSPVGETKTISDLPPLWGVNCQIEKWKDISSYYKRKINSKIKTCLLTALCNSLQKKEHFFATSELKKKKNQHVKSNVWLFIHIIQRIIHWKAEAQLRKSLAPPILAINCAWKL